MREIKFRAWDKSINSMMDVGEIHYCHGGMKVCGTGASIGNGWATEANGFKHDCDVVLMQYTGLKDKNGEEIYEGDILSSPHFLDAGGRQHILKHSVEWSDKFFGWFLLNCGSRDRDNGSIQLFVGAKYGQLEIIGNIYENPELMEVSDA